MADRWYHAIPPSPDPGPTTIDATRVAMEQAGTVSFPLWFSYLFTLFYFLFGTTAITHEHFFFEKGVKLPVLDVELPLIAYGWLAPWLFVLLHFYVLLHVALLAQKIGEFEEALAADPTHAEATRRLLPANIFIQLLAGPRETRGGLLGWFLKLIVWISLLLAPQALLIFILLWFLPYHAEAITWAQRFAVLADLMLLWTIWPAITRREAPTAPWRGLTWGATPPLVAASLLPLGLAFGVATFPGEWWHEVVPDPRVVPVRR